MKKIFLKHHKIKFYILLFFIFCQSTAFDFEPNLPKPMANEKAWYLIKMGVTPIGVGSVGNDSNSSGKQTLSYSLQFLSRVGSSLLQSTLQGKVEQNQNQIGTLSQVLETHTAKGLLQRNENHWAIDNQIQKIPTTKLKPSLYDFFPIQLQFLPYSKLASDEKANFFFNKNSNKLSSTVFVPFLVQFFSPKSLNLEYDKDGYLNKAELPLFEKTAITFERIDKSSFREKFAALKKSEFDLEWFASLNPLPDEIRKLSKTFATCQTELTKLNKTIVRQMPQTPYLAYRKIINMTHFCKKNNAIMSSSEYSSSEKNQALAKSINNLLEEDKQELPYSLSQSYDTTIFKNKSLSFLWPGVAGIIIKKALYELKNNIELEINRKSLVNIELNIENLKPRSVVRGDIELLSSAVKYDVIATGPSALALMFDVYQKKWLLNGQNYAVDPYVDLDSICEKSGGLIGVDLNEGKSMIVNSILARGLWDNETRINVARQFAIKATSFKNCNHIVFVVPKDTTSIMEQELKTFRNKILGINNELLLSNYVRKKIWMIPGKYRMTVRSLVSHKVLSVQEFAIEGNTRTTVVAKM